MNQASFFQFVTTTFEFLTSEFGFHLADDGKYVVRYDKTPLQIRISWDSNRSYEVDLRFAYFFDGEPSIENTFSIGEVLDIRGISHRLNDRFFQASNAAGLQVALKHMAHLLRTHTPDLLVGDSENFQRLKLLRHEAQNAFESRRMLTHCRAAAAAAWRVHDYKTIVALYGPIESLLSPAEFRKLEFARKKVDGNLGDETP